ncbi:MAG: hypothetical protein AAFQ87_06700 [Bacteroidota bacterium]
MNFADQLGALLLAILAFFRGKALSPTKNRQLKISNPKDKKSLKQAQAMNLRQLLK